MHTPTYLLIYLCNIYVYYIYKFTNTNRFMLHVGTAYTVCTVQYVEVRTGVQRAQYVQHVRRYLVLSTVPST